MNSYWRLTVVTSVMVLVGAAAYLGYWWYDSTYLREPTPPDREKVDTDQPPDDVKVTLPGDLQQDLQKDRRLQKTLYNQAVQAHSDANYDTAVNLYRRTIAHSGRDVIAAKSYQYLGDIYSRYGEFDRAIRLYGFSTDIRSESSIVHYRLGMTYWENGDVGSAGESLDRAIELEKRSDYYLARGNLHFEQGAFGEAETAYENGIQEQEVLLKLYSNLALARERQQKMDGALDAYASALNQNPEDASRYKLHMNKAKLHMNRDEYSSAVDHFSSARTIDATVDALYNLGLARTENNNLTGAISAFETALEQAPNDVQILTDLAYVHEQNQSLDDAITYYERALDQETDRSDIMFALGRLNEQVNNTREALSYYERVVKQEDRGERLQITYRRVGELYLKVGEPANAAPAFRNVLSLDSGNAEASYDLAIAYRRMGDLEQAIETFRQALELDPNTLEYQAALADTLFRAGFGEQALEAYQEVTKIDSTRYDAYYMVAHLHYRWGDMNQARRKFQSLIERLQDPTLESKTYQNLGNIYLRNRNFSNARTSYRQALEIQESAQTYFNLGLVYVNENNWEVASTVFRRALERDSDNPEYKTALGLVLYQKGLYREARDYLREALEDNPEDLRTHYNMKTIRQAMEDIEARTS